VSFRPNLNFGSSLWNVKSPLDVVILVDLLSFLQELEILEGVKATAQELLAWPIALWMPSSFLVQGEAPEDIMKEATYTLARVVQLQLSLSDSQRGLSRILGCKTAKRLHVEPLGGYPPVILVDRFFEHGCKEDDKPPPTLKGLINRYNRWVSTKRLHTKTLGSFAAQDAAQATMAITEPKSKPKPIN
jgi:hypothetical protein